MALGDLFASTRNRSPLQVSPLGQLPGSTAGQAPLAGGFDTPAPTTPPVTPPGTTPEIGDIPQNIQDLLGLFDTDPTTPGVQGDVAALAGMSATEIAAHFDLGPEYAQYFTPIQTGQLGGALGTIQEERRFGLGQAEDVLGLGTTAARQQFGAQAAGLRSGLLGFANLMRQRQAASGFAGAGATGAALGTTRREAGRQLGQAAGGFRTGLAGLQERFQTTQAGVQTQAESGIRGLLNQIAQQVGGFGGVAADLFAGGAKRLLGRPEAEGDPFEDFRERLLDPLIRAEDITPPAGGLHWQDWKDAVAGSDVVISEDNYKAYLDRLMEGDLKPGDPGYGG